VGITHFEEAEATEFALGHIQGRWTFLGDGAGSHAIGVNRIEVPAGGWSTPVHEHGREEEIFFVLGGRGLSWQRSRVTEIGLGDCLVYLPRRGAHTLHALEPLDVLAFGSRHDDEGLGFPRLEMSKVGRRAVGSSPGVVDGAPFQFVREGELGPPELPDPTPRPATVVNVSDVDPAPFGRGRVDARRRDLGTAVGSVSTGLKHYEVNPGKWATPLHCHSLEEELFVVLDGDGIVALGDEELAVRPGSVIARPPGTGVAHAFRAGDGGLRFLAYGTREPGDACYYPGSNKISFRGLGVIARLERLDYWDGEE
jgi:uncharacterized cupin superfamily protein